jgi:hypothetical protein
MNAGDTSQKRKSRRRHVTVFTGHLPVWTKRTFVCGQPLPHKFFSLIRTESNIVTLAVRVESPRNDRERWVRRSYQ